MKELWETIRDAFESGDLIGHLSAWWAVVTRRVTPETRAGYPTVS